MGFSYQVARPSEILAITGMGIDDIRLEKKAMIYPMQKYVRVDISPINYTFEVHAMSAEKLPFILPAVFTIGPRVNDKDSLILFAKLVSSHAKESNHVNELVKGIIEGETRVLAAGMTMEQIFQGTKEFKQAVFEKVQLELNQFGLLIYNANVKQLVDVPGHEYFSYLGQKIQMEAANQAKIDVAEAKMKGEIGEKGKQGETVQKAAQIDAETKIIATQRQGDGKKEEIKVNTEVKIFENQKNAEIAESNAELAMKRSGWEQSSEMAKVEAGKAVAIREAELQLEVEKKNAMTQTQKLKAELLSQAAVEYDIKVQEANWDLYKKQRAADAEIYEKQKVAEAQKLSADAALYSRQQAAEAELFAKQKEAEGIKAVAAAQGSYLATLLKPLGGNYEALRDYMMINQRVYQDIATINAQAVKGLQPKISIWSNGNAAVEGGGSSGSLKGLAGLYSTLPPLLETVHEQTGMVPPAWLGKIQSAS